MKNHGANVVVLFISDSDLNVKFYYLCYNFC
jgi:hypothetical protein